MRPEAVDSADDAQPFTESDHVETNGSADGTSPRRQPRAPGVALAAWTAVVAGLGFVAGLIGLAFTPLLRWDESYTPPSCFELSTDYNPVLVALAVGAGPLSAGIVLLGARSKLAASRPARPWHVAKGSRVFGTSAAVIATAPVLAYALVDVAYRVGVQGSYEFADRDACLDQLMPGIVALSLVAAIVTGVFVLGRTIVRQQ